MRASLRIARIDVGSYRLLTADFAGLEGLHRELDATIRHHLPGTTASLLARPVPAEDGATVDWYSDLAGEARSLSALPPARRARVKQKLADRLESLKRLADELPRRLRGSEQLAAALRAATHYPGDEHVFAVGDEPVLTLWGFVRTGARGRLVTPGGAARAGRARGRLLALGLTTLAMVTIGTGGFLWWMQDREQGLRTEVAGALAGGCRDSDRLMLLDRRIQQLDPRGRRLGALREGIAAEQQRCAEAEQLAADLGQAGWHCEAIAGLSVDIEGHDKRRPPFDSLAKEIASRHALCREADRLAAALADARGDCVRVSALGEGLDANARSTPRGQPDEASTTPPGSSLAEPLARVRARIETELARCAEAERLEQALVDAGADCEPLMRLDGQLASQDDSRPPLASLRERLEAGLDLCRRARALEHELIGTQQECGRIRALDERMQGPDMRQPPLREVREQLDGLLDACSQMDKLEQSRRDAAGDCPGLAALAEEVRDHHGDNLLFVALRHRIAEDTGACALAERLRAELAAAAGDCDALKALTPRIRDADTDTAALAPVRAGLAAELALCADAEHWRRRLAEAEGDCARLEAMGAELPTAAARAGQFADIRQGIETGSRRCRLAAAKARAAAKAKVAARAAATDPSPAPAAAAAPAKVRCPGVRKQAEAPQLVMVFDASGSMRYGINASPAQIRQLQRLGDTPGGALLALLGGALQSVNQGPSRMQTAKEAGRRILGGLPDDVDIGLVKIEDCPNATAAGFYAPAQRPALLARIGALQPRDKTPLASALAKAASMVDGVRRPAVVAVISDGEDTCGGNVCAAAARIARAKPRLRINVVDIASTGAADCAAQATGGRVLRAGNAAELSRQMQRATEEVAGPAECRGD